MEPISLILAIVLPSAAVLYAMYLTVKTFLTKEYENRLIDIKIKNNELILPTRLQAYERLCLLLERLSPNQLILRVNDSSYNAAMLHQQLLSDVRNEFNHNLSQQIYISEGAWVLTKKAIDDLNSTINSAMTQCDPEAKSIELAKLFLETYMSQPHDPIIVAQSALKQEIQKFY